MYSYTEIEALHFHVSYVNGVMRRACNKLKQRLCGLKIWEGFDPTVELRGESIERFKMAVCFEFSYVLF